MALNRPGPASRPTAGEGSGAWRAGLLCAAGTWPGQPRGLGTADTPHLASRPPSPGLFIAEALAGDARRGPRNTPTRCFCPRRGQGGPLRGSLIVNSQIRKGPPTPREGPGDVDNCRRLEPLGAPPLTSPDPDLAPPPGLSPLLHSPPPPASRPSPYLPCARARALYLIKNVRAKDVATSFMNCPIHSDCKLKPYLYTGHHGMLP